MTAVDWRAPNFTGEFFERFVGCLFGRRCPTSVRVRPAQGDHGIDIFVMIGDDECDVYQLKYYPDEIKWPKIEESLDLLKDGQWRRRTLRRWYLVIPQQPTVSSDDELNTQWVKFERVTAGVPFECVWFGEDQLHGLTAEFPDVVDYYLGNGREKLERLIEDWDNVTAQLRAEQPPSGQVVAQKLRECVDALERIDPHFRYSIAHSPVPPTHATPGALILTTVQIDDRFYTQQIFEKYRGAQDDAADRLTGTISINSGDALHALEHLHSYGGFDTMTLGPEDIRDFTAPSAGVIQEAEPQAQVVQVAAHVDRSETAQLLLMTAFADGTRTTHTLTREGVSRGHFGATARWHSPGQNFYFDIRTDFESNEVHIGLAPSRPFIDLTARQLASDVEMLVGLAYGTEMSLLSTLRDQLAVFEISADRPISPLDAGLFTALTVLQRHASSVVHFPPDPESAEIRDLIRFAALLEGIVVTERIAAWSATFASVDDIPDLDSPFCITHAEYMDRAEFGGEEIELREGLNRATLTRASHLGEIVELDNGDVEAHFVVGAFDVATMKRLADEEMSPDFPSDDLVTELGSVTAHTDIRQLIDILVSHHTGIDLARDGGE